MKKELLLLAFLGLTGMSFAQQKTPVNLKVSGDTVKIVTNRATIKPYSSVITSSAQSHKGLFTVHKVDDHFFFEIPDSLMNREFMAVTRYSKTPGGATFYGGELANQQVMYWEKGPNKNIFLRVSIQVSVSGDSTEAISRAVGNSNLNPIVATFDIKALSKDSHGVVIDVTDFFKGDNQVVSLDPAAKQSAKLTALSIDRSYIDHINTFPTNIEVHMVKTFTSNTMAAGPALFTPGSRPLRAARETGVVTLEMNTSPLLLPKTPMRKRYLDERVGFFGDRYTLYEDSSQRIKENTIAIRWRLEPKPEDLDKFRRGELVEPQKPIVYYIDPATPVKWRKYLIAGINDWQKAFEQAGFKNAISAKEWPVSDTTMSMEDARYSVLRYFASPISNAYGPNVHDPRSGEILESHIGWYHNVMKLVHDWYMIQAGAIDPRARKMTFDDELMGNLIRFVSSHEIGHTLGLRHNMGASSSTPVEKLRDKAWVEKNGHTVSIMDYARFNYVAQPEDGVSEAGIFPRIGEYDKWAIEWGYKPMPEAATAEAEEKILMRKTTARLDGNPHLWFGGEGSFNDPRSQSEDLGDNSMTASDYGIKNLKRVINGLPEWTKEEGDTYNNLKELYEAAIDQYSRYIGHVEKNIAGVYFTDKSVEQPGDLFTAVPKKIQKQAVDYINRQVFKTPLWLVNETIVNKLGVRSVDQIRKVQDLALGHLVNAASLLNVIACSTNSNDPYTLSEYFNDIEKGIWDGVSQRKSIDVYRRNLQKMYIDRLTILIKPKAESASSNTGFRITEPNSDESDVQSFVRADLSNIRTRIKTALPFIKDKMSIYHLKDILLRIDQALSIKS